MTGIQIAMFAGVLIAAGIVIFSWQYLPADPDLSDAIRRLDPDENRVSISELGDSRQERLGVWAMRKLPASVWGKAPEDDLRLLEMPTHVFYGKKVAYALVGLVIPPLSGVLAALVGISVPFGIPVLGSLALAGMLFLVPDRTLQAEAKRAREEYAHAVIAYIDLVALARNAGAGARQSLVMAAEIGQSRPFKQIAEALSRSAWAGEHPWDAIEKLANDVGVPKLREISDIMRLTGQSGAQVVDQLRQRSRALRDQARKEAQTVANLQSEKMNAPNGLIAVLFLVMLLTPFAQRFLAL